MATRNLTKEDWLRHALLVLSQEGYVRLKAQPLAKDLNVTRGSFYYHFDSLSDFHMSLVAYWSRDSSETVINRAMTRDDPQLALKELLQTTLRSGPALERAMRSWATANNTVATAVQRVDAGRVGVAEDLLVRCGVKGDTARSRARLLYWAAIGRLMMPFPDENRLSEQEVADVASLFTQKN